MDEHVKPTSTPDALESRLVTLERSNRRLKLGMLAAGLTTAGLILAGVANARNEATQGASREVKTQRLIITGDDGQPRVMMQAMGDGSAIFLYGPDAYRVERNNDTDGGGGVGRSSQGVGGFQRLGPRMRMQVNDDYARMQLLDPDGTERLELLLDQSGPQIRQFDQDGNLVE